MRSIKTKKRFFKDCSLQLVRYRQLRSVFEPFLWVCFATTEAWEQVQVLRQSKILYFVLLTRRISTKQAKEWCDIKEVSVLLVKTTGHLFPGSLIVWEGNGQQIMFSGVFVPLSASPPEFIHNLRPLLYETIRSRFLCQLLN